MDDADDRSTSFDPRSWNKSDAAAEKPAAATGGTTSFNPRTWTETEAGETASPTDNPPPVTPPSGRRPRGAIALGTAAAALAAAALLLYLAPWRHKPRPQATIPAVAPQPQTKAAKADEGGSRRTLVIAGPGEIPSALSLIGLPPDQARKLAESAAAALGPAPGEIRLVYELALKPGGPPQLLWLEATRLDGAGARLTASAEGGFSTRRLAASVAVTLQDVRGQMDATNFYSSAVTAGLDDSLISDFAKVLSFDFNFAADIQPGDVFEAVVEQGRNAAGEAVGLPRLLYVSMRTATKTAELYAFTAPGETQVGWYDANGRSSTRSLMRTPVDGARISSPFGLRWHPIRHYEKMHNGIDFASPVGTPIYASGTGVIEFAALKGCNGNFTKLRHTEHMETYYLHQSAFMPGIAPGAKVTQGQKIGEVGGTGCVTGPHLHYEVRIDGQPVDPQSIDSGTGKTLGGKELAAFLVTRNRIDGARGGQ